jgi:hypothetical protein
VRMPKATDGGDPDALPDLVHALGGRVTILHGGGFDSHVLLAVRG